ncbi:MAG: bifunctional methylenetetrahydrofolate dehydrogenase/methenyltetrahydrofolate cyclohydrolase FolD [Spirochaetaceae bacterium]|nr:MAG: bifunctional methylenetetrahydrofolate dehydrogenase/methenyltetrahydrofolate cyclohydrolase FolD [Spirochaetaceae bacterium]
MSAKIIDGKAIAEQIREDIGKRARALGADNQPGLAVVLVGEDPASISYVTAKERACTAAGMLSRDIRLPADTSQEKLLELIDQLNNDNAIHGILVQLPLPKHIDSDSIIHAIDPRKDVDAFHPENLGCMLMGQPRFLPCTPHGIVKLLQSSGITIKGANAVIVGRSNIVGKPLANMLIQRDCNATVTVCHTGTTDLAAHVRQADILVAAAGVPGLITPDMIKPGCTVIDVGVNRVPDSSKKKGYRLVGDVDFDAAKEIAGWITPVPGGVGPMTIAMLLHNTLRSAVAASEGRDPADVQ